MISHLKFYNYKKSKTEIKNIIEDINSNIRTYFKYIEDLFGMPPSVKE